jgi:hypothetical protein
MPIAKISPISESQKPRIPGQDRGKVFISPDGVANGWDDDKCQTKINE